MAFFDSLLIVDSRTARRMPVDFRLAYRSWRAASASQLFTAATDAG